MAKVGKRGKRKKRALNQPQYAPIHLNPPPLVPKNNAQKEYIDSINRYPVTVATGYPGTGKTYIPARLASEMYKLGMVETIYLIRPNVSSSKGIGYVPGTKNEKMSQWLAPVLGALQEEFTQIALQSMTNPVTGTIIMCPMEYIKGLSLDNVFVIVDEAEDLTIKEIKSVLTRIGKNSRIVLSGDIDQTDLYKSGLGTFLNILEADERLQTTVRSVDFDDVSYITRSPACREIILGFDRAEKRTN